MLNPLIQTACAIANQHHAGQYRHDKKTPYIDHVRLVVRNVIRRKDDADHIIVAWLHDLIEDTEITAARLSETFPPHIVAAVIALTHIEGETYEEAILRARANPIAREVKIADNLANLSDSPSDKQILKYSKSLQVLMT